ncbi:MAG: PIG-L family deacetylase [Dehalococcoidia bacterium]|nr:PIG-L family deacetylase [Dehalococcoidia bacterium]
MSSPRRLLGVFGHPDDETFGAGSTLARYASEGVDITVVTTTGGEVGEIAPGSDATPETLGAVREVELRSALSVLGVHSSVLLGYRDSGMAGTEDNLHPSAFINTPESEVLERLVALIRKHRPQVVATMDLGGGYGHPDHIRASELTTQAFKTAGDPTFPSLSGEEPWTPNKLYYHVFPRSRMVQWFNYIKETNPSSEMADMDPNTIGTPDEDISTVLEVSPYMDQRLRAAEQHRSQQSPFTMLPRDLTNEALSKDFWVRAEPPWHGGEMETDLFTGL